MEEVLKQMIEMELAGAKDYNELADRMNDLEQDILDTMYDAFYKEFEKMADERIKNNDDEEL